MIFLTIQFRLYRAAYGVSVTQHLEAPCYVYLCNHLNLNKASADLLIFIYDEFYHETREASHMNCARR